jgi:hypothetical protein
MGQCSCRSVKRSKITERPTCTTLPTQPTVLCPLVAAADEVVQASTHTPSMNDFKAKAVVPESVNYHFHRVVSPSLISPLLLLLKLNEPMHVYAL